MEAKISIEIKLKDNKKLKLNYEDGKKLYDELVKIYGNALTTYVPYYYPYFNNEPYYTGIDRLITCSSSSIEG